MDRLHSLACLELNKHTTKHMCTPHPLSHCVGDGVTAVLTFSISYVPSPPAQAITPPRRVINLLLARTVVSLAMLFLPGPSSGGGDQPPRSHAGGRSERHQSRRHEAFRPSFRRGGIAFQSAAAAAAQTLQLQHVSLTTAPAASSAS